VKIYSSTNYFKIQVSLKLLATFCVRTQNETQKLPHDALMTTGRLD